MMGTYCVKELFLPMKDEVRLYTRCVLPGAEARGTFPIVFIRTPYEPKRDDTLYAPRGMEAEFVKRGYAVVTQHCRGRGGSEGECHPYREREDGLETLRLLRRQPFYGGEFYLFGESYLVSVHLSYLSEAQPDIRGAVFSIQTDRLYERNYRNGCNYDLCNINWNFDMISGRYPVQHREGAYLRPYIDAAKRIVGEDVPEYTARLENDTCNPFWLSDPMRKAVEALNFPVLLTEGLYDFYIDGMFSMWERLPENVRVRSAMAVGPFGHRTSPSGKSALPLPHGNYPFSLADWFDHIRYGTPVNGLQPGEVTCYSVGADEWFRTTYPVSREKRIRLSFTEDFSADTDADRITYTYDPEVRAGCFPYHDIYRAAEPGTVPGVISFFSAPFEEDTAVFGKILWHMNVCSDCEDTAFFMRVCLDDGKNAYNLTETITALSAAVPDYVPGEDAVLHTMTPPMAFTVKKGWRLRVDIASDGGIYMPHANVRGHFAHVTETRVAHNTVCRRGAYLELPLREGTLL